MELFDPRLMKFLTFLTRHQAWLSPPEIARGFRLYGSPIASRTVHRWFAFLREKGGFVYYPYPRANVLGLQDVLVRMRGLRNPATLSVLPFGSSFQVEVGLADGQPFVSQGYWVPGDAVEDFREYWRAARDLRLIEAVELFQSRNTHFIFSPFDAMTTPDGAAVCRGPVDNSYFAAVLERNLRDRFEVRVGKPIAESPLFIPLVVEHLWSHSSSQQVWDAIRSKGEGPIRAYGKGALARTLQRPGAALRLLQQQWQAVLEDFDAVFLQPRVLFNWSGLRNAMWMSIFIRTGSADEMIAAAMRASVRSIVTSLKPGVGESETCMITCFAPMDQILPLLAVARAFHRDREPPVVALQDQQATFAQFQPAYCKVDWRLFDPVSLAWRFDRDAYVECLKGLKPSEAGLGS